MPRKRKRKDVYEWGTEAPAGSAPEPAPPDTLGEGEWSTIHPGELKRQPKARSTTVLPRFTPAAPVESAELFAGRRSQAQRLLNAIYDKGQHAVLYGERGVGKTSLALVTSGALPHDQWCSARVPCDANDDFRSLWVRAMKQLGKVEQLGQTFQPGSLSADASPSEVIDALAPSPSCKIVLFFDEFDRIPDPQVSLRMADAIKMLSDNRHDITVVVIGVADEASRLVVAHPSVQRALVEIHLPRMTADELRQVVMKAVAAMGMTVSDLARDMISFLSFGLPYFAHLVGLASSREALESGETFEIGIPHVRAGVVVAAAQMPERLRVAYDAIVERSPSVARALIAAASAAKDKERFFGVEGVRRSARRLFGEEYAADVLEQLPASSSSLIEQRDNSERPWRFVDPMFAPYSVLRALSEDRIVEARLFELFAEHERDFPEASELAFPFFDPDAKAGLAQEPHKQKAPPSPPPPRRGPPPPPPPKRSNA